VGVTLEILLLEGYFRGDRNLMVEMFVAWRVGCCGLMGLMADGHTQAVLHALCSVSQVTNDASIFAKQRRHDTNQVEVGSESAAERHITK
jgi:hypothetical protein